jgi:hypothetical protein
MSKTNHEKQNTTLFKRIHLSTKTAVCQVLLYFVHC